MSEAESRRVRIAKVLTAAWDDGEVDALDQLLSPDYQRHSSEGGTQGLAEFKATIVATRSAFPDLTTTVEDIVVEGDRAAVRWRSRGIHQHPFLGVPATRRPVEVAGATFSRFEQDRIVKEFVTWDPRTLLTALGILTVGQDR